MDSGQLHRLGRRLIELSRNASADPADPPMAPVEIAVLEDVIKNPDTSITEIGQRTGFAQSHVSTTVARLRERDLMLTTPDPSDGRRVRVRVSRAAMRGIMRRSHRPIHTAVEAAVSGQSAAPRVTALLDELAELLL
jgi:DNA-binding MarR family transcriptional regulator